MTDIRWDELMDKLQELGKIWGRTLGRPEIDRWLDQFSPREEGTSAPSWSDERFNALYLLTQFVYFGDAEIRALLRSLYRDLYRKPLIQQIREDLGSSASVEEVQQRFAIEQKHTRFLGVGNPSESGTHLLYYFRQENQLPKTLFIGAHEIFARRTGGQIGLQDPQIRHYVFIDDLAGSGAQAAAYSQGLLQDLRHLSGAVQPTISYYPLFATRKAIDAIRQNAKEFDAVRAVYELDDSFRCFEPESRYYRRPWPDQASRLVDRDFAKDMAQRYGTRLDPAHPLGYRDGQLLLGFHHNVPDNTLPIIWWAEDPDRWAPILPRYAKIYS